MFLGPINVRAIRKDVQFKVKEEYNSYKVRSFADYFCILHCLYNKEEFVDFVLVRT